jgi:hypothetical protein
MASFASTILQLALALLMSVQSNPSITAVQRQQAITVATQAIQLAEQTLGGNQATITDSESDGTVGAGASVPAIAITAPAGGEQWLTGSTQAISWNSPAGASDAVEYVVPFNAVEDANTQGYLISTSLLAAGPATDTWVVGTDAASQNDDDAIPPGQYVVKVQETVTPSSCPIGSACPTETVTGASEPFTIVVPENPAAPSTTQSAPIATSTSATVSISAYGSLGATATTLPAGANAATIGSYVLTASNNPVNLNSITIQMSSSSASLFQNVKVMVNGTQLGTTQDTVSGNGTYVFSSNMTTISPSDPMDLYVVADILPTASGSINSATTFVGCSGTDKATGSAVSCNSAPGGGVTFDQPVNSIPVQAGSISASQNIAFANQTTTVGAANVRIGSYVFAAGASEPVRVSGISIGTGNGIALQNLKIMSGGVPVGQTMQNISAGSGTYMFSIQPSTIPAGGSATYDVYADIMSAGSMAPATSLIGCDAAGTLSGQAMYCNAVPGQALTAQ